MSHTHSHLLPLRTRMEESEEPVEKRTRKEDSEEEWSLCVQHIPAQQTDEAFAKLICTVAGVTCVRTEKVVGSSMGLVSFANREQMQQGFRALNKLRISRRRVVVKRTKDWARRHIEKAEKSKSTQHQREEGILEHVNDRVAPWWRVKYEEQLQRKEEGLRTVLCEVTKAVQAASPETQTPQWVHDATHRDDGMCCELQRVVPSPVTHGYRNKSEFTAGVDVKGTPRFGFAVSSEFHLVVTGKQVVADPSECPHVSPKALVVCSKLTEYLATSRQPIYEKFTHMGFWRLLCVRDTTGEEVMIILQVDPSGVEEKEVHKEKTELIAFVQSNFPFPVTSLVLQESNNKSSGLLPDGPFETLWGSEDLTESVLGLKFRISPGAFFQVNTGAAEKLYSLIGDWIASDPETTVLDICCGTGTIGLTLAARAKQVLGLELVASAVEDAGKNAQRNGVTNIKFLVGRAEKTIREALRTTSGRVVGVVDPPRCGLHPDVLRALRSSTLDRLVYVCCNPSILAGQLVALCKPPTKRVLNAPFRPVQAAAVDMFPHTHHCELVVLLERPQQ